MLEKIKPGMRIFIGTGVSEPLTLVRYLKESNADNLVKELNQKGYNAEKFGKIGAMYAVSYDVFPSKQEADRYMIKMKREVDPDVWIKIID